MVKNKKVGILAECVCDLPKEMIKELGVDIMYFLIETETGIFTDTDEITAENVISHLESGGMKSKSGPPSVDVFVKAYEDGLKKYDELIHITISSNISVSHSNAVQAVEKLGNNKEKIHIFDSGHLSSGLGFLVIRAAELANNGHSADDILKALEKLKPLIYTSFMTYNADYLARNGLVPSYVQKLCRAFNVHPVLCMRDGKIKLLTVFFGDYEKACRRYIKRMLNSERHIDTKCAFVTHVGCSVKLLKAIRAEADKHCVFKNFRVTNASATISSNCGPGTFGILFMAEEK